MPDFLTHTLFAQEGLGRLPVYFQSLIGPQRLQMNLGSQGPDPFFYYGQAFWQKDRGYAQLASRLHQAYTDDFLKALWTEAKKRYQHKEGPEEKAGLLAYATGFVAHYALDSQCHPYVHAMAGFSFNGQAPSWQMGERHKKLEVIIDDLLFVKKKGLHANMVKIWHFLPDQPAPGLEAFYQGILPHLYDFSHYRPGDLGRALRDMRRAQRLLYDPQGWKAGLLGRLQGKGRPISPKPFYPQAASLREGVDYLNQKNQPWPDPFLAGVTYRSSFLDLYEGALDRFTAYMEALLSYLAGDKELEGIFEGYAYDSKLVWDSPENRRPVRGQGLLADLLD